MNIAQDRDFSKEIAKLKTIVRKVPKDRRAIAETLLQEIIFMTETLEELRAHVLEHGAVDLFKQGKQKFSRESPALKAYNTTIQRYSLLYKQIIDMLPKTQPEVKKDALMGFIQAGDKK